MNDVYYLCMLPQVNDAENTVGVEFTPTIPHCSMATLIGLSIKVKLLRSLPDRFKVCLCMFFHMTCTFNLKHILQCQIFLCFNLLLFSVVAYIAVYFFLFPLRLMFVSLLGLMLQRKQVKLHREKGGEMEF